VSIGSPREEVFIPGRKIGLRRKRQAVDEKTYVFIIFLLNTQKLHEVGLDGNICGSLTMNNYLFENYFG